LVRRETDALDHDMFVQKASADKFDKMAMEDLIWPLFDIFPLALDFKLEATQFAGALTN